MRKTLLALAFLALLPGVCEAQMTLQDAQDEADAWVAARWDAIKDRVKDCLLEPGGPEKCHTAWSAQEANYCANTVALSQLCSIALDDPGTFAVTVCDSCYTGEQTFAQAGITIPGSAPVNATINIALAPSGGRGEQLITAFEYDGVIWEKGYGDLILPGFDWQIRP